MNNELYHYGVKGMKWGVQKDRSSGKRPKGRSPSQDDLDTYNKLRKQSAKTWREYDQAVNAKDKKRYTSLYKKANSIDAEIVNRGSKFVDDYFGKGTHDKLRSYELEYGSKQRNEVLDFMQKYDLL